MGDLPTQERHHVAALGGLFGPEHGPPTQPPSSHAPGVPSRTPRRTYSQERSLGQGESPGAVGCGHPFGVSRDLAGVVCRCNWRSGRSVCCCASGLGTAVVSSVRETSWAGRGWMVTVAVVDLSRRFLFLLRGRMLPACPVFSERVGKWVYENRIIRSSPSSFASRGPLLAYPLP